jgi:hypothetical protein
LSKQMVTLAVERVQAATFWLLSRGASALDLSDPQGDPSLRLRVLLRNLHNLNPFAAQPAPGPLPPTLVRTIA